MSCYPTTPCYGTKTTISYPKNCGCGDYQCVKTDTMCYAGPNLPCIGATNMECLDTVLQKIDNKLCGASLVNTIVQVINTNSELKELLCEALSDCFTTTTTTSTSTSTTTTTTSTTTTEFPPL